MQSFIQTQQSLCVQNTIKPLILCFFFLCSFLLSCGGNSADNNGEKAKPKECKCIAGKDGIPILMPKQKATIEELQKACSKLEGHLQDCS